MTRPYSEDLREFVNGGRILGQGGGVKAGQWW